MDASYYLVQHIPSPFRREARNVGLIVRNGSDVAAKFLGEKADGGIDHRKIQWCESPALYEQWIEYWRFELRDSVSGLERIIKDSTGHFRLATPSEVEHVNGDSAREILARLYPSLVGERRVSKHVALPSVLVDEFSKLKILSDDGPLLGIPHPIQRNRKLPGTSVPHRPAFVQEVNDDLYIIQTIETHKNIRAREKAGNAAYMFIDIAKHLPDRHVIPISVVSGLETLESEAASEARAILTDASQSVIEWPDEEARKSFLMERTRLAKAA